MTTPQRPDPTPDPAPPQPVPAPPTPKIDDTAIMIAAANMLIKALSVRALLAMALVGAFIIGVFAMAKGDAMSLWTLGVYAAVTVIPVALLEMRRREPN